MADVKLCECGCGNPAPIAKKTSRRRGYIKGQPMRFISHHYRHWTGKFREKNPSWKGGETKDGRGYVFILFPNHPHANNFGYVRLHRLKAEKALGRLLPIKCPVHHHSETQLVICQSHVYHLLLHIRTRAYRACGHADWRKCPYCKRYDSVNNLMLRRSGKYIQYVHLRCRQEYEHKRYEETLIDYQAGPENAANRKFDWYADSVMKRAKKYGQAMEKE